MTAFAMMISQLATTMASRAVDERESERFLAKCRLTEMKKMIDEDGVRKELGEIVQINST